jgi:hypothetical protein
MVFTTGLFERQEGLQKVRGMGLEILHILTGLRTKATDRRRLEILTKQQSNHGFRSLSSAQRHHALYVFPGFVRAWTEYFCRAGFG